MKLTEGDYTNLKLTTPEDLVVASRILEARRLYEAEHGAGDDDDDEDEEGGRESISQIRANERWTNQPRPIGSAPEDEKESISQIRANEKWVEGSPGEAANSYDEPMVNLSKMRANS